MDGWRRELVFRGVVVPLLVGVVVIAVAVATDEYVMVASLLATVPILSAQVSPPRMVVLVSVLTMVGALVLAALDGFPSVSAIPIIATALFSAVAIWSAWSREKEAEASSAQLGSRSRSFRALQTQAETDPTTGLLNRRGAVRALGPRNIETEMLIAFVDCDRFAEISSEHGAEVLDEYLQAVAGRLRNCLAADDVVARWESDEFLLAITAQAWAAPAVLERVLERFQGRAIRTAAGSLPGSVSIGAATWPPGQGLDQVFTRAGKALLQAKTQGGNQIVLDADPRPSDTPDGEERQK